MKNKQSSLWVANEALRKKSNIYNFCKILNKKKLYKKNENFNDLWKWSVRKPEVFWSEVWNFTKIKGIIGKKILKKFKFIVLIISLVKDRLLIKKGSIKKKLKILTLIL